MLKGERKGTGGALAGRSNRLAVVQTGSIFGCWDMRSSQYKHHARCGVDLAVITCTRYVKTNFLVLISIIRDHISGIASHYH